MQKDDEEERRAICEIDGGLPQRLAALLAWICHNRSASHTEYSWGLFCDDCARFLDRWGAEALKNMWSNRDLYALFVAIQGRPVIRASPDCVIVCSHEGERVKIMYRPTADGKAQWIEGDRDAADRSHAGVWKRR